MPKIRSETCPECGSPDIRTKSRNEERCGVMCYVTYRRCGRCGNEWEPPRTFDLCVGPGKDLKVPDGAVLRAEFTDGDSWEKTFRYLDPVHFTLDGDVWDKELFRNLVNSHPGTVFTVVGEKEGKRPRRGKAAVQHVRGCPKCPYCSSRTDPSCIRHRGTDRDGFYFESFICPRCLAVWSVTFDGPDDTGTWEYDATGTRPFGQWFLGRAKHVSEKEEEEQPTE